MILDSPSLRVSAQRWMHAGLEKFVDEEDMDFAVHHFGVATEHLLKAHLASLHPALVVDGRDFASLLHAVGHGQGAAQQVSGIRSITGADAFDRCRHLLKSDLPDKNTYQPLLNARNGVSHIGYHDRTRAREYLIIAIRVADPLLAALNVDVQGFWGTFDGLRVQLLAEHADELRVAYEAKVASARTRFDRLGGDHLQLLGMANLVVDTDDAGGGRWVDCPVCGYQARLAGTLELAVADWDDENGFPTATEVVFYSDDFACRVCGLTLSDNELSLANLPREIATEIDPADLHDADDV